MYFVKYLIKKTFYFLNFFNFIIAIISDTFQGKLLIETFTKVKGSNLNELDNCSYVEIDGFIYKYEKKIQKFL